MLNGIEVVKGFNINDKEQAFTEMILAGVKTEETRKSHSLDPLIGKRVAIIRTGRGKALIVGTCMIEGFNEYRNEKDWSAAFKRHRVGRGSKYDFTGFKVGYVLRDVKRLAEPVPCKSRGIVIRNI